METPVWRSSEFAGFLVEKGDMLAHSERQVQEALLVYDRALRVFGYEASQKQFAVKDANDISLLLSKKGKLLMQRVQNAGAETAALEFFG